MFHFKKFQLIPATLAILLLASGCTTHARSTDPSNPTAADSLVLIFLRHGEVFLLTIS